MTGDTVENFTLKDQNGNNFILYENLDKKLFLLNDSYQEELKYILNLFPEFACEKAKF